MFESFKSRYDRAQSYRRSLVAGFWNRVGYTYRLLMGRVEQRDVGSKPESFSDTVAMMGIGYAIGLSVAIGLDVAFFYLDAIVMKAAPLPLRVVWFVVTIPLRIFLAVMVMGKGLQYGSYLTLAKSYKSDKADRIVTEVVSAWQRVKSAVKRRWQSVRGNETKPTEPTAAPKAPETTTTLVVLRG